MKPFKVVAPYGPAGVRYVAKRRSTIATLPPSGRTGEETL